MYFFINNYAKCIEITMHFNISLITSVALSYLLDILVLILSESDTRDIITIINENDLR